MMINSSLRDLLFPEFGGNGGFTPDYGGGATGFGGESLGRLGPAGAPPAWALDPYSDLLFPALLSFLSGKESLRGRLIVLAPLKPTSPVLQLGFSVETVEDALRPYIGSVLDPDNPHSTESDARRPEEVALPTHGSDFGEEVTVVGWWQPGDVVQIPEVTVWGRRPDQVAEDIRARTGARASDVANGLRIWPGGPTWATDVEDRLDAIEKARRRAATPLSGVSARPEYAGELELGLRQRRDREVQIYFEEHTSPRIAMVADGPRVRRGLGDAGDSIAGAAAGAYMLAGQDPETAVRGGGVVGGVAGLLPAGRGASSQQLTSAHDAGQAWASSAGSPTQGGAPVEPALPPTRDRSLTGAGDRSAVPSVDPPGFRRGGNAYKRDVGVERSALQFTDDNPGARSLGRELQFDVVLEDGSVRLNLDELFEMQDGSLTNVESKWGQYASFTEYQRAAGVPVEATLLAVPTEATSLRTGLPRYPQVIQTRVFRWLWDGIGR